MITFHYLLGSKTKLETGEHNHYLENLIKQKQELFKLIKSHKLISKRLRVRDQYIKSPMVFQKKIR